MHEAVLGSPSRFSLPPGPAGQSRGAIRATCGPAFRPGRPALLRARAEVSFCEGGLRGSRGGIVRLGSASAFDPNRTAGLLLTQVGGRAPTNPISRCTSMSKHKHRGDPFRKHSKARPHLADESDAAAKRGQAAICQPRQDRNP